MISWGLSAVDHQALSQTLKPPPPEPPPISGLARAGSSGSRVTPPGSRRLASSRAASRRAAVMFACSWLPPEFSAASAAPASATPARATSTAQITTSLRLICQYYAAEASSSHVGRPSAERYADEPADQPHIAVADEPRALAAARERDREAVAASGRALVAECHQHLRLR